MKPRKAQKKKKKWSHLHLNCKERLLLGLIINKIQSQIVLFLVIQAWGYFTLSSILIQFWQSSMASGVLVNLRTKKN